MFDIDRWQEVWHTLSRHKLRTVLTGFGVFWGIFMLCMLLGMGNGLQNGVQDQFKGESAAAIWVWPNVTSKAYNGRNEGRELSWRMQDLDAINAKLGDEVKDGVPRNFIRGEFTITRGTKQSSFDVSATMPNFQNIRYNTILQGRYLNETDITDHRKVAVIGIDVYKALFDAEANENAIGESILVKGVHFIVVGVSKNPNVQNDREGRRLYLPFTTAKDVFRGDEKVDVFILNSNATDVDQVQAQLDKIRLLMARRHDFAPDDEQAANVFSPLENFKRLQGLFLGIKFFVSIVGIATLLAGMIGVSNIMLIIVKERTREIGVRKALGATPGSIIGLVLTESIVITLLSGYIGLVLAISLLELISRSIDDPTSFFQRPEISLPAAIASLLLLTLCGAMAGFFPARHAANIQPIEALRAD
jgi:putative ABC transport system permease protein